MAGLGEQPTMVVVCLEGNKTSTVSVGNDDAIRRVGVKATTIDQKNDAFKGAVPTTNDDYDSQYSPPMTSPRS